MAVAGEWYRTGTCNVTNGNKIVNFTGAALISAGVAAGHAFIGPDGKWYEIEDVNSETQLTLYDAAGYGGPSQTGQPFAIMRNTNNTTVGDLAARMNALFEEFGLVDLWKGQLVHNMTTNADYTLTTTESYNGRIKITDTGVVLTAARNIIVPNDARPYNVQNSTAQTLTFKTGAGSGIAVPAGTSAWVYCDGTNVINVFDYLTGISLDNLTNLTVAANSSGNVSRHVMTTAIGGISDANYYAKLCTFTVSTSAASYINKVLELTDTRTGSGESNVSFIARCDATGTIDTINTKVTVNKNNYSNLAHNGYFLVQPSAGILELWVQKTLNYSQFNVRELASNEANVTNTSWNDGATWQAAAPTGTTITSDWAGASTFVPVAAGEATPGVGTYTAQYGYAVIKDGFASGIIRIGWSAHTGTGNLLITGLPIAANNAGAYSPSSVYYNGLTVGSGKECGAIMIINTGNMRIYAMDPAGGASTALAIDTSVSDLIIWFKYKV